MSGFFGNKQVSRPTFRVRREVRIRTSGIGIGKGMKWSGRHIPVDLDAGPINRYMATAPDIVYNPLDLLGASVRPGRVRCAVCGSAARLLNGLVGYHSLKTPEPAVARGAHENIGKTVRTDIVILDIHRLRAVADGIVRKKRSSSF